jgi:ABC-type multidrug transport system fused ATPase/permease subunit
MKWLPKEIRALIRQDQKWLWLLFSVAALVAFLFGAELVTFLALGQILLGQDITQMTGGDLIARYVGDRSQSQLLILLGAVFAGIVLIRSVFFLSYNYLTFTWASKATARLHTAVMERLLSAPTSVFDKRRPGEIIHGLMEAPLVVTFAIDGVSGLITSIFTVLLICAALAYVSPWLLIGAIGFATPVLFSIARPSQRWIRYLKNQYIDQRTRATHMATNIINSIRDIKALSTERQIVATFSREVELAEISAAHVRVLKAIPGPALQATFQLTFAGTIVIMASFLSPERLIASLPYFAVLGYGFLRVYPAATKVSKSWLDLNQAVPGLRITADWTALPKDELSAGTQQAFLPFDAIRFQKVSFGYLGNGHAPALVDVDFCIDAGKITSFVGESGSGKSTLIDLLLKFRAPETGDIWLGEQNLREVVRKSWLQHVGVVRQEVFLFAGTIRDNFLAWKPDATEEEMVSACRQADALGFINRLADGLDTVVGDRGVTLSGGQRQRIALARALLRNPQVLILDEAFSALDGEAETQVLQSLLVDSAHRTIILVSHRLTTVQCSGHIIVLDHGRVVEQGAHEMLLEKRGRYRQLFSTQMGLSGVRVN